VIGGPPCQAFSRSNGYKRPRDPRASLSTKYAKLLRALNRRFDLDFFVFENVVGLREDHPRQFARVKELFSKAGFEIFEGELDASEFGVAQVRKRVFIVGFNRKRFGDADFVFPKGCGERKTVGDLIRGLPHPKYFERGELATKSRVHPNHWCMKPKSERFKNGSLKPGKIEGRPFRVLSWEKPSWTVAYGNREVHIHPSGKRRLSVLEAMLLQGFPRDYELHGNLSQQIKLVSDAVPPPVAQALGRSIAKAIRNGSKK
jgi:DNA (cytosine-5)-methyltransferase 1